MEIIVDGTKMGNILQILKKLYFSSGQHGNSRWRDDITERSQNWEQQAPPDLTLENELFTGMNSGINFDKYEEIPVEATGENCPAPINHVFNYFLYNLKKFQFTDLNLHPWICENIKKSGYDRPTPVQVYMRMQGGA